MKPQSPYPLSMDAPLGMCCLMSDMIMVMVCGMKTESKIDRQTDRQKNPGWDGI